MANFRVRLLVAPFLVFGGLWVHELVQVQSEPLLIVNNAVERAIPFLPWTILDLLFFFYLYRLDGISCRERPFLALYCVEHAVGTYCLVVCLAIADQF